jgi:hypothetical protein
LGGLQRPFFADPVVAAPLVRFWGQVRPGATHTVLLQRRSPAGAFVTVARIATDQRGAFLTTLPVRGRGAYRFRTLDVAAAGAPTPPMFVSDVVSVTPVRAPPAALPLPQPQPASPAARQASPARPR